MLNALPLNVTAWKMGLFRAGINGGQHFGNVTDNKVPYICAAIVK